jgi:hypothetical protein
LLANLARGHLVEPNTAVSIIAAQVWRTGYSVDPAHLPLVGVRSECLPITSRRTFQAHSPKPKPGVEIDGQLTYQMKVEDVLR